jgi:hypothetical protein
MRLMLHCTHSSFVAPTFCTTAAPSQLIQARRYSTLIQRHRRKILLRGFHNVKSGKGYVPVLPTKSEEMYGVGAD